MYEKTITSEIAYNGGFIRIKKDKVLLENGKESFREVMLHPGACAVVPVMPDGRIILVRQFRYAFMKEFLEIPAGKIDPNEEILTCARRELSEEIGYDSENMRYLGKICPSCGCMNEVIHLYVAENLYEHQLAPDEDEDLQLVCVTRDEALAMIASGEIDDAKTICALLRYFFGV